MGGRAGGDLSGSQQADFAAVVDLAAPVVELLEVGDEVFTFSHSGIMGHELAADGDVGVELLKFENLFVWVIATVEKCQINSETAPFFCDPFWDDLVG